MNDMELSRRLQKVASYVEKGSRIADIGSDHAYLPVYLVSNQIAKYAIAGEVNAGPLKAAMNQIEKYNLSDQVKAKLGNGLEVIKNEEIDTVTIAGMGGPLISQILENGKSNLKEVRRLILQPNIAAEHVRRFLVGDGWELKGEAIIEEDGHIYEILMAERGDPQAPYGKDIEKQLWLGPFLIKEKTKEFIQKWTKELQQLEKIHYQLNTATPSDNLTSKKQDVLKKMTWLKEELL